MLFHYVRDSFQRCRIVTRTIRHAVTWWYYSVKLNCNNNNPGCMRTEMRVEATVSELYPLRNNPQLAWEFIEFWSENSVE